MKALMGSGTDVATLQLLDEIRALRNRVEELETALEQAEDAAERVALEVDVRGELIEAGASA
jgi:cell division septum initiation protein DivIVA